MSKYIHDLINKIEAIEDQHNWYLVSFEITGMHKNLEFVELVNAVERQWDYLEKYKYIQTCIERSLLW